MLQLFPFTAHEHTGLLGAVVVILLNCVILACYTAAVALTAKVVM